MKLDTLALVAAFSAFGISAEAQTCGVLCDLGFWGSASEAAVKAEITKADVNARREYGSTSLMTAAGFGTAENLQVLLRAGADVNARSEDGGTALMWAAGYGALVARFGTRTAGNVKVLVDAGADMNARREDGSTALMLAARYGTTAENVKVLLDAGADGFVKDKDGKTAWDYAQDNEALKGTDAYWMLNDARFK